MGHEIRGYADLYQDIMNDAVDEIGRSNLEWSGTRPIAISGLKEVRVQFPRTLVEFQD
jgi:hypothetical protein